MDRLKSYHESDHLSKFISSHPHHSREARAWADTSGSSIAAHPYVHSGPDLPFHALVADNRLMGQLNVSRGLGDFALKFIPDHLRKAKQTDVIDTFQDEERARIGPMGNFSDIRSFDVNNAEDIFNTISSDSKGSILLLLSASDGLWDFLGVDSGNVVNTVSLEADLSANRNFNNVEENDNSCDIREEECSEIGPTVIKNGPLPLSRDPALNELIEFLSTNDSFTHCLLEMWKNLPENTRPALPEPLTTKNILLTALPTKSSSASLPVATPFSCGESATFPSVGDTSSEIPDCFGDKLAANESVNNRTPVGSPMVQSVSDAQMTPRGNSSLQKVADEIVKWAVHGRNSSDNTSVVLVAVECVV
eukprot:GDKK01010972.1.p1 GENE.GDKK01010972.1~~GDKK01010972.1.p1  ORF type:complete len:394 (-),score=20.65 GDKK01010972.1:255-1343(-)